MLSCLFVSKPGCAEGSVLRDHSYLASLGIKPRSAVWNSILLLQSPHRFYKRRKEWIWRNWNTYTLLLGMYNCGAAVKNHMEVLHKINDRTDEHMILYFNLPTRTENRNLR